MKLTLSLSLAMFEMVAKDLNCLNCERELDVLFQVHACRECWQIFVLENLLKFGIIVPWCQCSFWILWHLTETSPWTALSNRTWFCLSDVRRVLCIGYVCCDCDKIPGSNVSRGLLKLTLSETFQPETWPRSPWRRQGSLWRRLLRLVDQTQEPPPESHFL